LAFIGNQLSHRVDRQRSIDREADNIRTRIGDWGKILDRIEWRILVEIEVARHGAVRPDHKRIAVRLCARHMRRGDVAACT
jgi:hypothetical protein